jgi:hypothetical protein
MVLTDAAVPEVGERVDEKWQPSAAGELCVLGAVGRVVSVDDNSTHRERSPANGWTYFVEKSGHDRMVFPSGPDHELCCHGRISSASFEMLFELSLYMN